MDQLSHLSRIRQMDKLSKNTKWRRGKFCLHFLNIFKEKYSQSLITRNHLLQLLPTGNTWYLPCFGRCVRTWNRKSSVLRCLVSSRRPGHVGSPGGHRPEGFSAPGEDWTHQSDCDHMIPLPPLTPQATGYLRSPEGRGRGGEAGLLKRKNGPGCKTET